MQLDGVGASAGHGLSDSMNRPIRSVKRLLFAHRCGQMAGGRGSRRRRMAELAEHPPDAAAGLGWRGPVSFWRAHLAAWAFIALFGLVLRIATFGDSALALTLTLVLDPIGCALTALGRRALPARLPHRPARTTALVVAASILGGLLRW
jgi:hypothetical protein